MIMTEFQTESHDFAMMVNREFRRKLKIPARGVDQAGFFVLNRVFTPSVLIEAAFISNPEEERLLNKGSYQKDVAEGIYDAIKRFKSEYESD
jgi:N-acetylmuramoyl-L-alanine amidase